MELAKRAMRQASTILRKVKRLNAVALEVQLLQDKGLTATGLKMASAMMVEETDTGVVATIHNGGGGTADPDLQREYAHTHHPITSCF